MYNISFELLQKNDKEERVVMFIQQGKNDAKEKNHFYGVIFNITVQTLFLVLQPYLKKIFFRIFN